MVKWTKQDILELTVSEAIDKLNLKVKLGAKSGSAFVYCGYLQDINVEALDKSIIDSYERTIKGATSTINALTNKPKGYNDFVKEMEAKKRNTISAAIKENGDKPLPGDQMKEIEEKYDTSRISFKKWLAQIFRKLDTAKTTKRSYNHRIKTFTSIATRKLVDMYKSIDEADTYILLYEGIENGRAWTTKEFESGYIDYGTESED